MTLPLIASVIFIAVIMALALSTLDEWCRERRLHKRMSEQIRRELQRKEVIGPPT